AGASTHQRTGARGAARPRREAFRRALVAAVPAHGPGDDRLFLLRLDPMVVPELDTAVLPAQLPARPEALCRICIGGFLCGSGGRYARRYSHGPAAQSYR